MNNHDLGRVHAYLLRHRYVETKSNRRNISKDEREVATLLRDADPEMKILLREILNGQGLELIQFGEFDVAGIPSGATVFMVARSPDTTPSIFGTDALDARMRQVRGIQSDMAAKIWFVQLWFIHLDLIYSRRNRGPHEMQDYVGAVFTRDTLIDATRDYINDQVRKTVQSNLEDDTVYRTLTSLKEGSVADAVNAFLELLLNAGLIEKSSDETYRQTLLSAYEMKANYDRQLSSLMPSEDIAESATNLLIHDEEMIGE